jgi:acetylglutamate kinase
MDQIDSMIQEGIIKGGMIPKVEACLRALESGTEKTHIIDGRIPHALLLEVFTDEGIGTEIIA